MSLVRRAIEMTITQPDGSVESLKDLRMYCGIEIAGGYSMGVCQARVYGVPLSLTNKLTSVNANFQKHLAKNAISVWAGNEGSALSLIYQGDIQYAFGEYQDAPDVCLEISAYEGASALLKPAPSTSYSGSADVATVMHDLATKAGYGFENNGVTVQLSCPAYSGPILSQLREIADHAGINFVLDRNVVAIWPEGETRAGAAPTISPGNGMVGYPKVSGSMTYVRTLFRPDVNIGSRVNIENSTIPVANGPWVVNKVQHNIAAHFPDGPWFTDLMLTHTKS